MTRFPWAWFVFGLVVTALVAIGLLLLIHGIEQ